MVHATLRRSVRLFRAFLAEQSDPDHFYRTLAADSVGQLAQYVALHGKLVLDVGGGPGYFADAFQAAGAHYISMDLDAGGIVRATGTALPVRSKSVAICYSSNVLEHVAEPWQMANEMVRVTKPGGTVFLSFTPWLSPWGGHETAPWHYLGGHRARRRYAARTGRQPKNRFGESLFAVSVAAALRWARSHPQATLIEALPRYHPSWAKPLVHIPALREVALWNLALILRRR